MIITLSLVYTLYRSLQLTLRLPRLFCLQQSLLGSDLQQWRCPLLLCSWPATNWDCRLSLLTSNCQPLIASLQLTCLTGPYYIALALTTVLLLLHAYLLLQECVYRDFAQQWLSWPCCSAFQALYHNIICTVGQRDTNTFRII